MKFPILSILIGFSLISCSTSKVNSQHSTSKAQNSSQKTLYLIDLNDDGAYSEMELEKADQPKHKQGNDQWIRDFYRILKYPASARKNGIQGVVKLMIMVDKLGRVQRVEVDQSLSPDCDMASKNAYLESTNAGFEPLQVEGKIVSYKMLVPVRFGL